MAGPTVADAGEFGLIGEIVHGLDLPLSVPVGPGDDCAVFSPRGDVAVSTDAMVEDVHFRRVWSGPHDVGRKAVASAMADVEAMGATPVGVVLSLTVPPALEAAWVAECASGVKEECAACGASLLGGDVTRGEKIALVATVFGDLAGRPPVLRSGARAGDVVAYIGRLGMAAAGLAVLSRGFRSPGAVVKAHRVPEPPYGQGATAAVAGASAMIDCSDGLVADLGHVAEASGVTIEIDTAALEVSEPQRTVAAAIGGGDPLNYLLGGGDDHALLATFAPADVPAGWTVIGRVAAGEPAVLVDGEPWAAEGGWTHF